AYPANRGFVDMWVPSRFYLTHTAALDTQFLRAVVAEGVCAAWWDVALTGGTQLDKQALAARYAGLDISRTKSVSMDVGDQVPGVHWVTYLRSDRLARLGGRAKLQAALPGGVRPVWLENGGIILRLAEWPQLGDRNRQEDLPAYCWLAQLLQDADLLH